nr:immunoglobulin heavy chain junction region [Mus musculus]
CAREAGSDYW